MIKLPNRLNKSHFFKWLLFLIISFLSWNYLGILFIINLVIIFDFISRLKTISLNKYISICFLYSFLWHLGAMGWLLNVEKGFYGLVLNILVYLIPFIIYFIISKFFFRIYLFIVVFIIFEIIINISSFSNPLLTIGNSLGNQIYLSQWYRYTSVMGGSLWLLILSYIIHQSIKERNKNYFLVLIVAVIPISFSLFLYFSKSPVKNKKFNNVVVFNLEYYKGKQNNINIALHLYNKLLDSKAEFLILPETTFRFNSIGFKETMTFKILRKILNETSINKIFFGSQIQIKKGESLNVGIYMDSNQTLIKVKKKLVPFTEYIPNFMRSFFKKETFVRNYSDNINSIINEHCFLPLICYEGFYPLFNEIFENNTDFIFLVSSEHFIKDSFYGKKQYLNFIRLRSIENKTPLIKGASYGYSCYINERGDIIEVADKSELYLFHQF